MNTKQALTQKALESTIRGTLDREKLTFKWYDNTILEVKHYFAVDWYQLKELENLIGGYTYVGEESGINIRPYKIEEIK